MTPAAWVLVIYLASDWNTTPTLTTVPGFGSEASCAAAGNEYIRRSQSFSRRPKVDTVCLLVK